MGLSSRISFDDPRLRMTLVGRLIVRVLARAMWIVLMAITLTLLVSDMSSLRWLGIFFALFLVDRLFHLGEADRPLEELPAAGNVDIARFLTPRAFRVIEDSFQKSALTGSGFTLHVLFRLMGLRAIREAFLRLDVPPAEFEQKLQEALKEIDEKNDPRAAAETLAAHALAAALEQGSSSIDVLDLFAAAGAVNEPRLRKLLTLFSLDGDDLKRGALLGAATRKLSLFAALPRTLSAIALRGSRKTRHRIMNRAWTSRPTPTLDRYAMDLTDIARDGHVGFMIGHEAEYRRLADTLARSLNPNALLVGENGSGRETIIAHLALNLTRDKVPAPLFDKRLVSLDLSLLVASAGPDELQARLRRITQEIETAGNVILYIPNIHNLVKTSGTAYLSAADALLPILTNNSFPVIGTTFPRELKVSIEPRSDFASLFETIPIEEVSEKDAEKILIYESLLLERTTGVAISLGAIEKAVGLAKKYFRDKMLPSSAEELLKSAVASASGRGEKWLRAEGIIAAAEGKTNVPLREAGREEIAELLNLEAKIHERLVDQEEAVSAISQALREYRSGLARPGGPIASFLFVGPTGVGKTELAKIITSIQFGKEEAMIRFDMTEFGDKQSLFRFIGSPDQTVSGALTEAVRQKPFSLILLDEFEKAYPDILNLFLQVLDDGRLTDNAGRVIDFTNSIIIATSNAHSELITESLSRGESMEMIGDKIKHELITVFKPELLNRFSKIIVFKNLAPNDLLKVAELSLKSLKKLLLEQGIELSFSSEAVRRVAELGYDPAFGARPLRRVIDEKLKAPLANAILKHEVGRGGETLIDVENGEFVIRVGDKAALPT